MGLLTNTYREEVKKSKNSSMFQEARTPIAYSTGLDLLDHMNGKYNNVKGEKGYYSLGIDEGTYIMLIGKSGTAKAQPLDADIITPSGIVKMGDLNIGDLVSTPDGKDAKVLGIFPQGKKDVYRVHFNDNSFIDCADEHLHTVKYEFFDKNKRETYFKTKVVNTLELIKDYKLKNGKSKYFIPMTKPVEFELVVNDFNDEFNYLYGCSIIDFIKKKELNFDEGNLSDDYVSIKFFRKLQKEFESIHNFIDYMNKTYNDEESFNKLFNNIRYSSIKERIEFLRGIIDSYGDNVSKNPSIFELTTELNLDDKLEKELLDTIKFVVQSLGGILKVNHKLDNLITIKMPHDIKPFSCKRLELSYIDTEKYIEPYRIITNIEKLDKKVEMQCIYIDSDEHLYLTNDFIATHNTTIALQMASKIIKGYDEGAIFLDDIEGATDNTRIKNITKMSYEEIEEKVVHRNTGITCESFFENISMIYNQKMKLAKEHADEFLIHTGKKDFNGNEIISMPPTVYILDSLALLVPENISEEEKLSGCEFGSIKSFLISGK